MNDLPVSRCGQQIQPGHRMPSGRTVEIMAPVVRALACAHEPEIVHCAHELEIVYCAHEPDNVFVTDSGTIQVLDLAA